MSADSVAHPNREKGGYMKHLFVIGLVIILSACSDQQGDAGTSGDHVWKQQTDTIDRAGEVESMVMDQAGKLNKSIEDQAR